LAGASGTHELWQGQIAPGSDWGAGRTLCRRIHATLPQDLDTGEHTLALDSTLLTSAETIKLGSIRIGPSTRLYDLPELARTVQITFTGEGDGEIGLVGLSEEPVFSAETGEIAVDLVWRPAARINGNYKAFVHLLDSTGAILAQSDAIPGGNKTTARWLPGEIILDRHILTLPPAVAAGDGLGDYELVAGLYDPIGMQRLPAHAASGDGIADGRAPLGSLSMPSP
jgi:hypothetical protein